jgi:hypothetical protein
MLSMAHAMDCSVTIEKAYKSPHIHAAVYMYRTRVNLEHARLSTQHSSHSPLQESSSICSSQCLLFFIGSRAGWSEAGTERRLGLQYIWLSPLHVYAFYWCNTRPANVHKLQTGRLHAALGLQSDILNGLNWTSRLDHRPRYVVATSWSALDAVCN